MLHPQTIAAAVLAIVAALNGSDALDAQPARRVRPPRGQQYDFWFGTSKLTELKFQKKFRLSRDAFVDLTESIRGDLGKNAAACALSPESKLAVTLRWLGGASAWELTQIYWPSRTDGVDHSSFYYIVRQVMRAIIRREHGKTFKLTQLMNGGSIDALGFKAIEAAYARMVPRFAMRGCIGAIDRRLRHRHAQAAVLR